MALDQLSLIITDTLANVPLYYYILYKL